MQPNLIRSWLSYLHAAPESCFSFCLQSSCCHCPLPQTSLLQIKPTILKQFKHIYYVANCWLFKVYKGIHCTVLHLWSRAEWKLLVFETDQRLQALLWAGPREKKSTLGACNRSEWKREFCEPTEVPGKIQFTASLIEKECTRSRQRVQVKKTQLGDAGCRQVRVNKSILPGAGSKAQWKRLSWVLAVGRSEWKRVYYQVPAARHTSLLQQ